MLRKMNNDKGFDRFSIKVRNFDFVSFDDN